MPTIILRPRARRDPADHARYLNASRRMMGHKFLEAAPRVLGRLARSPSLGAPYPVENPELDGLRCWTVPRFKNHVVFYQPIAGGIRVIRVLHGAQDVGTILEGEAAG